MRGPAAGPGECGLGQAALETGSHSIDSVSKAKLACGEHQLHHQLHHQLLHKLLLVQQQQNHQEIHIGDRAIPISPLSFA